MWSPQVAKGSGSAAEVGYSPPGPNFLTAPQPQRKAQKVAQVSCAQETHPNWQLFWLPQLGLVLTQLIR